MIYIKTRGPADAKALLTYITKDLKVQWPGFGVAKTPARYPALYGSSHKVIGYDFETHDIAPSRLGHHTLLRPNVPLVTVAQFKRMAPGLRAALTQPFVKSPPAFLMGFEIEGCVAPDYRADLINYIIDLYPGVGVAHLIHHDGSIRPKNRAIELVTPPLPIDEAIERVEWLFGMLSVLTEEGAFQTNHTTGLHVNVSETKSFSCPNRQARARFAHELMKRLDAAKWARAFRRTGNRYCWWAGVPESVDDVHQDRLVKEMARQANEGWIDEGRIRHWRAINTEHLNAPNPQARRVEVRVAGGKDYHARSERLNEFLLDIRRAAHEAFDSI